MLTHIRDAGFRPDVTDPNSITAYIRQRPHFANRAAHLRAMNLASTSGIARGNGRIEAIEIDVSTETQASMNSKLATGVRGPHDEAIPAHPNAQTANHLLVLEKYPLFSSTAAVSVFIGDQLEQCPVKKDALSRTERMT
jgi:hypothetical protein